MNLIQSPAVENMRKPGLVQSRFARVRSRRDPHAVTPPKKMEICMNKIFAALAVAGLLAMPALSHADDAGMYVNGSVGQAHYGKSYYDSHHFGYDLNLGYRWSAAPAFQAGVEAGYVNLGNYGVRSSYPGISLPKATLHGWTLGGTAKYDITPNWYVSGRAGLFRWTGRTAQAVNGTPTVFSGNGTSWYAGAGFGYNFDSNWSLGLNYNHYHATKHSYDLTSNLTSVSAEYRF